VFTQSTVEAKEGNKPLRSTKNFNALLKKQSFANITSPVVLGLPPIIVEPVLTPNDTFSPYVITRPYDSRILFEKSLVVQILDTLKPLSWK